MTATVEQSTDTYLLGTRRAIAETIDKATTHDQLDREMSAAFFMLTIVMQYWPLDAVRATGLAYEAAFYEAHKRLGGDPLPSCETTECAWERCDHAHGEDAECLYVVEIGGVEQPCHPALCERCHGARVVGPLERVCGLCDGGGLA